jgi:hypothetical protein
VSNHRAQVVAGDHCLIVAKRMYQPNHIANQLKLRLTLDGKPAPGNLNFGKTGAATIPLIDPPRDTEAAKTAKVVGIYTFPGPNLTPAGLWDASEEAGPLWAAVKMAANNWR